MLAFRKIWRALLSCDARFEIRPFALLPTYLGLCQIYIPNTDFSFEDLINIFCHTIYRGCLCDNWKSRFLSRFIFNWRIFSRRVTTRWSRG